MGQLLWYTITVGPIWFLFGWQPAIPTFCLAYLFYKFLDWIDIT